jgi:hypothetical protein
MYTQHYQAKRTKELSAQAAAKQPLTARLAGQRAGWVQRFFWRFDSVRNTFA